MALTFLNRQKTTDSDRAASRALERLRRETLGDDWRLPGITDRTSIVGKTGSGKTTAGLFLLSASRLYRKMPWVILDYKGDEHIARVPARLLKPGAPPPVEPGIYRLHCSPFQSRHGDPVEDFLQAVWENGNTGLFFDEAYMLPDRFGRSEGGTLRPLFTTGRARHIPIISLTQRPMDVTKYNFSEASHHVIFRLNDKGDRDTVRSRVPNEAFDDAFGPNGTGMPEFESFWYDVGRDRTFEMEPFPHPDEVIADLVRSAKVNSWM